MKITEIKTFRMSATPHKSDTNNWLFLKIYTDTGIYGVGEGSLQYKDLALLAEIEDFSKFLIGKDPFAIEYIDFNPNESSEAEFYEWVSSFPQ